MRKPNRAEPETGPAPLRAGAEYHRKSAGDLFKALKSSDFYQLWHEGVSAG